MLYWRRLPLARLAVGVLCGYGSLQFARAASVAPAGAAPSAVTLPVTGPTLRLDEACKRPGGVGIPVREFMYFVPLISPEPVDCTISAGSTQQAAMKGIERSRDGRAFTLHCRFALVGAGALQNDYDHTAMVNRNAELLRGGGRLAQILGYIRIEGEGDCTLTASGEYVAGVPVVQRVTLGFAGRGGLSPVRIGLLSISGPPEAWSTRMDAVACVASLAFARTAESPRMDVRLASLRDAHSANTLVEKLKGALKGAIANLLIPPVGIEASGNQAMLDFAAALYSGAPAFAFPLATNLRSLTVIPEPAPGGLRTAGEAPLCPAAPPGPAVLPAAASGG